MKNNLILITTILYVNILFSQLCGTTGSSSQKSHINPGGFDLKNTNYTYCLDVKFHFVKNSDGSPAFNLPSESVMTNTLNSDFNRYGIYFNSVGVNHINNSNAVSINNKDEFRDLDDIYNDSNSLNIYIVDSITNSNNDYFLGYARDIGSNALLIARPFAQISTLSHEVGHCLNLLHTHETSFGVEQINGNNCSSAGDFVCDTPADPDLDFSVGVDSQCNYIGDGNYNPLTDNIMSYTRLSCMENFTEGQLARMYHAINNLPVLQNVKSNNCFIPELAGSTEICYNSTESYSIIYGGQNVTWEVSSNLSIVNSNNTGISVTPLNDVRENGFIRAKLPDRVVIEKPVWLGKPDAFTIDSNGVKDYSGATFNFQQQIGGTGQFSVFSDAPNVDYNFTGPANITWNQVNRNTVEVDISNTGSYTFTAEFKNSCGTYFYFIFVDISTASNSFNVFPNPSSGDLTISSKNQSNNQNKTFGKTKINTIFSNKTEATVSFQLFDLRNNLILSGTFIDDIKLDLKDLKNGVYILRLVKKNKNENHRVIKK